MHKRQIQLSLSLAPYPPSDRDRVAIAVSTMLASFRSMRQTEASAVATVSLLVDALSEFPAWAIEKTCASIRVKGWRCRKEGVEYMEKNWPPNDANVVDAVREVVAPYRRALENAKALLAAPIDDQAMPARKTYDELAAECAEVGIVFGKQEHRMAAKDFIARYGITREQFDAIPDAQKDRS